MDATFSFDDALFRSLLGNDDTCGGHTAAAAGTATATAHANAMAPAPDALDLDIGVEDLLPFEQPPFFGEAPAQRLTSEPSRAFSPPSRADGGAAAGPAYGTYPAEAEAELDFSPQFQPQLHAAQQPPYDAFGELGLPPPPVLPPQDAPLAKRDGRNNSKLPALDWPASYFELDRSKWGALKRALEGAGFSKAHLKDLSEGRRRHKGRGYSTKSRGVKKATKCVQGDLTEAQLRRTVTNMAKKEAALRRDKELLKEALRRACPGAFEGISDQLSTY